VVQGWAAEVDGVEVRWVVVERDMVRVEEGSSAVSTAAAAKAVAAKAVAAGNWAVSTAAAAKAVAAKAVARQPKGQGLQLVSLELVAATPPSHPGCSSRWLLLE